MHSWWTSISKGRAHIIRLWTSELNMPDNIRRGLYQALDPSAPIPDENPAIGECWPFMKISPKQFKYVLEKIQDAPLPALHCWYGISL